MKGMYRESKKRTLIVVQRLGQTRATSPGNVSKKSNTYYTLNQFDYETSVAETDQKDTTDDF